MQDRRQSAMMTTINPVNELREQGKDELQLRMS
jgi:hypothetical protein